jgi:hypothetical protein
MSVYTLKTFADIYTAAMEQMKIQSSDTVSKNRIKRDINMIYLNEVVPYHPWKWLDGSITLTLDSKFNTGTATVVQGSATVTLTTAPGYSRKGDLFATDGTNEIYTIAEHTASSTTITLDAPYLGESGSELAFKIWTYKLPLPVDCRQTKSVFHDHSNIPLDAISLADFEKYSNTNARNEARPAFYTTADYVDASSYESISGLPAPVSRASDGLMKTLVYATDVSSYLSAGDRIRISAAGHYSYNGDFVVRSVSATTITYVGRIPYSEATTADTGILTKLASTVGANERYRQLWVWPSAYQYKTNLHVSYVKDPQPLEEDSDEPLMPLSDRAVLLYGALMQAWSRERNPEEAARNATMYDRKLSKMLGKFDDASETPILRPSHVYLSSKRSPERNRASKYESFGDGGTGGSSTSVIRGTANTVTIFDGNGELSSSAVTPTELAYVDGVTSAIQTQIDSKQATITGAATTITSSDLTASRAVVSNAAGKVAVSATTDTELGYVSGVTSAIQTQINTKAAGAASSTDNALPRFDGAGGKTLQNSGVIVDDSNNITGVASLNTVTSTEIGYISGVTSAIQTQIDTKAAGAASSTDNAIARFDGATGKIIQNSAVVIDDSNNMTGMANGFWTGPVGVLASAAPTSAALNVGGGATSLSGTTQIGLRSALVGASDATTRILAFSTASTFGTSAASFTCAAVINYYTQAITKGAGSTVTRTIGYKTVDDSAGTNNAHIADNETFSGDWAINLASTRASLLTGGLQFNTSGGTKTTLNYYEENTFTITGTGFASNPTGTARFIRIGSQVTMFIPQLSGTSNATTFTMTGVPARLVPARDQTSSAHRITNNGTDDWGIIIFDSDGTFYLFRTAAAATWTNSGTKTLYETVFTYSLT